MLIKPLEEEEPGKRYASSPGDIKSLIKRSGSGGVEASG
jgi:hypothetical protein